MNFYLTLEAPWQWALVNIQGEVVDRGSSETLQQVKIPSQVSRTIGVAPGEFVTTREVEVPGRRRSNVEAALPYALEESLTEDVEDLQFTLLNWRPGQSATVAIVAKEKLISWVEGCKAENIQLDRIVPGYLLLPLHQDQSITLSALSGGSIYVRSGELAGFSMEKDFFPFWLDGEDFQQKSLSVTDLELAKKINAKKNIKTNHWDIGNHIGGWLKIASESEAISRISLLHGEFMPAHRSQDYRPIKIAAVCGLFALVIMTASMIMELKRLKNQDSKIENDTITLFKKSFPKEPYLGRPKSQVESLLGQFQGNSQKNSFQRLLSLTSNVLANHNGKIEEINFRDQSLTILCSVTGLSVLDQIQQSLRQLPGVSAELLSSGARDNEISGRFRVTGG